MKHYSKFAEGQESKVCLILILCHFGLKTRVFGKCYHEVVRGCEASVRGGGTKQLSWSGSAPNTFYAAIRKVLVVIVARALALTLAFQKLKTQSRLHGPAWPSPFGPGLARLTASGRARH